MTEYIVMLSSGDQWWTSMTDEQRAAGYEEIDRFGAQASSRGHEIVGGAELQSTVEAKRIPAGGGPATDGPFAEVAEQVGGFFRIRTDDLDDLLDCCQILAALEGAVTVTPVVVDEERAG